MQEDNEQAVNACAEAIKALVKPKAAKLKMSNRLTHKLPCLTFITHPKLGKWIGRYSAKGCRLCQPKTKGQTEMGAAAPARAPGLIEGSLKESLSAQGEDRWTGVTLQTICSLVGLLCCFLQINLRQNLLFKKKKANKGSWRDGAC